MKRIIIFTLLKIVEAGGIFGAWLSGCYLCNTIDPSISFWLGGSLGLMVIVLSLVLLLVVGYGLCALVRLNWDWTKEIELWIKRKLK